ncbi:hypothetical protein D3OALGA1CA_4496 [Olavius algarvensis associated proteobacterium Delta 3]|nr:hypothetical protein D3OALGA1CA_4496 [Olavius algarvensis associated proteobacterium Delta 3]
MSFDNSIAQKLQHLLAETDATQDLSEGDQVTLKINTAEEGYEYGLRPVFIRIPAQAAYAKTKLHVTICDGLKLIDYWKQHLGSNFMRVASHQGYSNETLGGHLAVNGGFSGDEGDLFSCQSEDSDLGGVEVGTAVCRSDALWVLSHVTLHPLFGLSGALLNSGFECLVGSARSRVVRDINPYPFNGHRPPPERLADFRRHALECCLSIRNAVEGRLFFISYLWDITPQPEYFPFSNAPIAKNLGFLASRDPAAIDAVALDLIGKTEDPGGALGASEFRQVLELAEAMGIGSAQAAVQRIS